MPRRNSVPPEPEQPREHRLTEADVFSITGEEVVRGTARFLPSEEVIKESIKGMSVNDPYMMVIDALYTGSDIPEMTITFNEGFPDTEDFEKALFSFLIAHLVYIEVDSELRILGLTYLLKQIITITEPT
jgi:hypothetical protein